MKPFALTFAALVLGIASTSCGDVPTSSSHLAAGVDESVIPMGVYPFAPIAPTGPALVAGFIRTDELGNVNGSWGTMMPGSGIAYPNPTNGSTIFTFALFEAREIVWWVEKAYGPGEEVPGISGQFAGGTYIVPHPILLGPFSEFVAAGVTDLSWDGEDAWGAPVPDGYYRIYVVVPDRGWTGFWDILIERD
jgi:hypothetical protein